jgi:hypothetical protein
MRATISQTISKLRSNRCSVKSMPC